MVFTCVPINVFNTCLRKDIRVPCFDRCLAFSLGRGLLNLNGVIHAVDKLKEVPMLKLD